MCDTIIGIVGGGPGGLIALYECKKRNITALLFEKQNTFGGVWNLNSTEPRAHGSTLFNSSYFVSTFDLDEPRSLPGTDYMTSAQYHEYLTDMIDTYKLGEDIIYNQEVLSIDSEDKGFALTVKDRKTTRQRKYIHNYVIICTGRNGVEQIPSEPFLSKDIRVNKGLVWHSGYWDPLNRESKSSGVINKECSRILVIGGSHSAAEAIQDTLELAMLNNCSDSLKIFWAPTRDPKNRSVWMMDRYPYDGKKSKLPADEGPCRLYNVVPSSIVSNKLRQILTPVILHQERALPEFTKHLFSICKTRLLKSAIDKGTVEILDKSVLRIENGLCNDIIFHTTEQRNTSVNIVVLATGYSYEELKINGNFLLKTDKFHRDIIPLDERLHGRLGFIGTHRIIGSSLGILQMEVRWLLYQWFNKKSKLESTLKDMLANQKYDRLEGCSTNLPSYPLQIMDRLAKDIDAMPCIWSKMITFDRHAHHVALACLLTPASIHQYRDPLETDKEKCDRENILLLNAEKCFQRANLSFRIVRILSDLIFNIGLGFLMAKYYKILFSKLK